MAKIGDKGAFEAFLGIWDDRNYCSHLHKEKIGQDCGGFVDTLAAIMKMYVQMHSKNVHRLMEAP